MSRFDASLLQRALQALGARPPATPPAAPPASAPAAAPTAAAKLDTLAAELAAQLCRRFEGLYLVAYLCPAGVATIGYGATYYEDGRAVRLTDPPITRDRAEQLLLHQVRTVYLPAVQRLCPGVSDARRLAALVDFCFNLGAGQLAASTLRRRVNAQRWAEVPPELRKWVRGGGRVLRGLVARREAEAALI